MCGICFYLKNGDDDELVKLLSLVDSRGPDGSDSVIVNINKEQTGCFYGSILWLQGERKQQQPMTDENSNVLLWNGDIFDNFQIDKNSSDTQYLMKLLNQKTESEIANILSDIKGPWSILYYQHSKKKLYIARDVLGRHSLLWSTVNKKFLVTSVAGRNSNLREVPALGLFIIDFTLPNSSDTFIHLIPWNSVNKDELLQTNFNCVIRETELYSPIKNPLNKSLPSPEIETLLENFKSMAISELYSTPFYLDEAKVFYKKFKVSIQRRVNACPNVCKNCTNVTSKCSHTRFAVLFSGGLDSAVMALGLSHCLPQDEPIDLLNISFQRINNEPKKSQMKSSIPCFSTPDRSSGYKCLDQLKELQPDRKWNFIEINITLKELTEERQRVISDLIAPNASVLDDSIGCAFYFCGRGKGTLNGVEYESPARVLLSGLGADEQLAGYARHRKQFQSAGWKGLVEEIEMEINRIHSRNLARDNRVLSHHGRAPRYPFLDEDLVSYLNSIPIWKKTNLFLPRGVGDKIILRVLASFLGLTISAALPKQAIQFGSKIAKLENSKEKGSDVCQRL